MHLAEGLASICEQGKTDDVGKFRLDQAVKDRECCTKSLDLIFWVVKGETASVEGGEVPGKSVWFDILFC